HYVVAWWLLTRPVLVVTNDIVEPVNGAVVGLCSAARRNDGDTSNSPPRRILTGAGPPVHDYATTSDSASSGPAADFRRGVIYVLTPTRASRTARNVYRGVRAELPANV
ncbi:hypothetical protein THAOC_06472, partial [Thalassiosira oceanica]